MDQHRLIAWWLQFLFCCIHSRILVYSAGITSPDFSPSAFKYRHPESSKSNSEKSGEIDLGTTLVAIKFNGGVVVGADTRTSVGGYVSNKFAYKINPIFEPQELNIDENCESHQSKSSCVLCRSGSAADTQYLAKQAKRRFEIRKLERPGYTPSVSEVAHYLRYQMRHSNEQENFQASLICAGYDEINGGRIYGITPGGSLWEEENFCVSGSGSTILLGYLDDALKATERDFSSDFTKEQAKDIVTKLLQLSIGRDGSSGGLVRLYIIDRKGLEETTVYPTAPFLRNNVTVQGTKTYTDLDGFASPNAQ